MDAKTVERFRGQLVELSRRLRGDIESLDEQARVPTGGQSAGNLSNAPLHLGDVGSEMYLQELNATLLENQQSIQVEVMEALQRIDDGAYGDCERCGKPIIEERLELLPYTRYCAPCAAEVQAGRPVNLNDGRPEWGGARYERPDPDLDEDVLAAEQAREEAAPSREDEQEVPLTDLQPDDARDPGEDDIHAAGTAAGGTAVGGLAGTNVGGGNPDDVDLEDATGSGNFDVGLAGGGEEGEEDDSTAYSGPAGGAVGGTPAGKRAVGGKRRGGIAPRPEAGDDEIGS